jgi:hypothetical protein
MTYSGNEHRAGIRIKPLTPPEQLRTRIREGGCGAEQSLENAAFFDGQAEGVWSGSRQRRGRAPLIRSSLVPAVVVSIRVMTGLMDLQSGAVPHYERN